MRKQYKFIKHSKTIKSKIPSQTTPCHKRYIQASAQNYSFIGNWAKTAVQSNFASYHNYPRLRRDGKPIPYGVIRHIQDSTLKAGMFSIVLFMILCGCQFCCVIQICLLIVWLCFQNLLCFARKFWKGIFLFNNIELAQCRLTVLFR